MVFHLDIPLTVEHTTPYGIRQYLLSLEFQIQCHQRKPTTDNKTIAALSSWGAWLVGTECRMSDILRLPYAQISRFTSQISTVCVKDTETALP